MPARRYAVILGAMKSHRAPRSNRLATTAIVLLSLLAGWAMGFLSREAADRAHRVISASR